MKRPFGSWFRKEEKEPVLRAPRPHEMTGRLIHTALWIGQPGTGKTTNLQELVERNWLDGCRFVISDTLGYWGYAAKWPNVTVLTNTTHEESAAYMIDKVPFGTLVIDEVAEAFPKGKMPDPDTALSTIARVGRNASAFGRWRRPGPVALLAACQQPYQVDVAFRGCVDRFYVGRLEEQASLTWVRGVNEKLAARVEAIPYGRFVVYDRL